MINEKLNLLYQLYEQVKGYEDRQWIGFLIAVEERKFK